MFSMMWLMPQFTAIVDRLLHVRIDIDLCQFGAPSLKPTSIFASSSFLQDLALRCQRTNIDHRHVTLKGKERQPDGSWQWRTKAAQVYPDLLCQAYAQGARHMLRGDRKAVLRTSEQVSADPLDLGFSMISILQFSNSFEMKTPSAERKRPLGQPCAIKEHRQKSSGKMAVASGYQMRRGLVPPVF